MKKQSNMEFNLCYLSGKTICEFMRSLDNRSLFFGFAVAFLIAPKMWEFSKAWVNAMVGNKKEENKT